MLMKTKVINKTRHNLLIRWIHNKDIISVEIYDDTVISGYFSTTLLGPDNWSQVEVAKDQGIMVVLGNYTACSRAVPCLTCKSYDWSDKHV